MAQKHDRTLGLESEVLQLAGKCGDLAAIIFVAAEDLGSGVNDQQPD